MEHVDLLVIGAGAAGLRAALSAYSAGCRSILLADRAPGPGGVLKQCLHRGFGLQRYGTELTGPEYIEKILSEFPPQGIETAWQTEVLCLRGQVAHMVSSAGFRDVHAGRIILATGARERNIGELLLSGTRPSGVYTAGQVQEMINLGGFCPGRDAVIVGCGDLGMIIARHLTEQGCRVAAVLEQEAAPTGMARNLHRCIEAYTIPVRCRTRLVSVHGQPRVTGVTVLDENSGTESLIPCDTLITAIGLVPERTLADTAQRTEQLIFCGNCSRIHDLIDSADAQAAEAGREALL